MHHLILGGARSGKSAFAEQSAKSCGTSVGVIATAWALDDEMAARIIHHRAHRPIDWLIIENPASLAKAVLTIATDALIIDCLTLWLTTLMARQDDSSTLIDDETDALIAALKCTQQRPTWIVSNEIGLGVVPLGRDTRAFVDALGRIHQRLAQCVDQVVLMVAGMPLTLKPSPSQQK